MSSDRVPVLPPGVPYLIQALNDDDLGFREIADAIEKVPSVAARLLALANSAWSSPVSPVLALDVACSRLGMHVVRTASIAIAVSQPFNPARCPAFDGRTFWSAALLNADAATWLAEPVLGEQRSAARTAALLSNLGLIWLAESLPAQTAQAFAQAVDAPSGSINLALASSCGLGYDEAGALLAEAWRLPPALRDAIAHQFTPRSPASPLCQVVGGAIRMVGAARHDMPWQSADAGLDGLGLDLAAQQAVFGRISASIQATTDLAENLFSVG